MAAVYGHVGPFDENTETFGDYGGRYEAFMVANRDLKIGDYGLPTVGREAFATGMRQRVLP